jgi:hypothetical protein
VVGAEGADANGNFPIYRHAHGGWWHFGGKGVALAVEPSGRPWVVTGEGKIYRMTRLPTA